MQFFNIDFATLTWQLLPVRLRKSRLVAWMRCLILPVETLYSTFITNRSANNYYVAHTGQVCSMEALLNDRFDVEERRFEIHNGPFYDPVYTFIESELRPVYLALDSELSPVEPAYGAPMPLYTSGEIYESGVLFIVYYPEGFTYSPDVANEMKALIDRYRLPGKKSYLVLEGPAPPLVV